MIRNWLFAITRIISEINVYVFHKTFCVIISRVRIDQRVGYESTKGGYETSGYETSMGTKLLDTV